MSIDSSKITCSGVTTNLVRHRTHHHLFHNAAIIDRLSVMEPDYDLIQEMDLRFNLAVGSVQDLQRPFGANVYETRKIERTPPGQTMVATTSNVVDQPLVDIGDLNESARRALLDGPSVQITFHAPDPGVVFSSIEQIPKRLLMAMSATAQEVFRKDSESLRLSLSRSGASPRAVRWVCAWMVNNCLQEHTFAFQYRSDWSSNVSAYQVMTTLGMYGPITNIRRWLMTRISSDFLSYDELTSLLTAVSPNDPVFLHLANTYAYQRHKRYIPDPAQFSRYLAAYPAFAYAMNQIDIQKSTGRLKWKAEEKEQAERRDILKSHSSKITCSRTARKDEEQHDAQSFQDTQSSNIKSKASDMSKKLPESAGGEKTSSQMRISQLEKVSKFMTLRIVNVTK